MPGIVASVLLIPQSSPAFRGATSMMLAQYAECDAELRPSAIERSSEASAGRFVSWTDRRRYIAVALASAHLPVLCIADALVMVVVVRQLTPVVPL